MPKKSFNDLAATARITEDTRTTAVRVYCRCGGFYDQPPINELSAEIGTNRLFCSKCNRKYVIVEVNRD